MVFKNSGKLLATFAVVSISLFDQASAFGQTVAAWQFPVGSTTAGVPGNLPGNLNTMSATTGAGSATELGMTNNYTYAGGELGPSVADCDLTVPGSTTEVGWRVRGNSNAAGPGANGWNLSAPQYSQGVQFTAPTTGYNGITFSFDWYCTTQGVKDMQPQYTINGTTWTNVTSAYTGGNGPSGSGSYTLTGSSNVVYGTSNGVSYGDLVATSNNWSANNTISFTLSGTAALAVANNQNFAVRLVSAYDPTTGGTTYSSAKGGTYNNSSGNWSFNNITIGGGPILSPLTFGTTPATTVTWTSATGGAWSNPSSANWSSPYADGYGVVFPDLSFSGTSAVTIAAAGVNPGAIGIGNSTGTYLFSGGPIGGGTGLAGTGSLGLTDSGAGVVILASSNSYIGGTAVTAGGTLVVQGGDTRLGASGGEIFLGNGSTLQTGNTGIVSSRSLIFGPGGGTFNTSGQTSSTSGPVVVNGSLNVTGGGNLTLNGNVVTTTTAAMTTPVTIAAGTTLTIGGPAGAEQNFLQSGGTINGTLVINAPVRVDFSNSTYGGTGTVQISSSGGVNGNGSDGSSAWSVLSDAGTTSTITSGGTLTSNVLLNTANVPHIPADITNPNFSLAAASSATNAFVVGIGANKPSSNTFAITGNISGNSDVVLGANDTSGDGNGRVLLSGSNTYVGTTLIAGKGIVALGSSSALPSSTDVVFNFPFSGSTNPVLDLNGNNAQINSLSSLPSGAGTKFSITNSGSVPATLTISGSISPAYPYAGQINDGPSESTVGLVKQGAGLLGLSGISTYSGGTTISGGTLQLGNLVTTSTASALGLGSVTVQSGGVLAGSAKGGGASGLVIVQGGGQLMPGGGGTGGLSLDLLGGLTLNASSSISYVYGTGPSTQGYILGGTGGTLGILNLPTTGQVTINVTDLTNPVGIIPLFTFGTLSNFSSAALTLGANNLSGSAGYSFVLDSTAKAGGNPDQIDLWNPSIPAPANVTWSTSSAAWNTSTTSTAWTGGTPVATAYKDGDQATFPNYTSSSSTVTVDAGGVAPSNTIISSGSTAYTFTGGPIGGLGGLSKTGNSLATLAATNSYSGGTTITGGTLVVGAGDLSLGASGSQVLLDNNATLRTTGVGMISSRNFLIGTGGNGTGGTFDTTTLSSTLSGVVTVGNASVSGSFTKIGAGTLTITGTTNVVDAASDTGSMLVSQAGNLHISGPLSLGTYGSLYIGSGGTITLDNLNGTVDQNNGGLFNGTLVVTNGLRLNFNNNNLPFTGTGQIAVQGPGVVISNGSGTPGGTVGVNIVLNSSNLPFAKTDVAQTTLNTSGTASFISTIGGTKIGTTTGPGSLLAINGVISGNSDVNFSNSPGGGGSGNIQLNAKNTYTGASLIDFTGNANGGAPGGNVYLGVSNALPATTDVVFGAIGGLASATLDLNGNNQAISSLSDGASGNASGYNVTNSSNANSILTISGTTTPARPYGGFLSDGLFGYTLAIVKSGANTLTLSSSANGYSGGTTVYGGQLLINTSINGGGSPTGAGDVVVTGGTFGGVGNVGNLDNTSDHNGGYINVNVGPGAALAPGLLPYGKVARTPGTLNIAGNLTLSANSNVNFNDFSGSGDQVDIESVLTLPGTGSVIVSLSNIYGGMTGGTVQLFDFVGGSLSGGTLSPGQLVIGNAPSGASYAISENPNGSEIDLTITPSSAAALTVSGGTTDWGAAIFSTPNTTVTLSSTSSAPSTITVSGNQSVVAIVLNVTNSNGITLSQGSGGSLALGTSAGASISAAGGGSSAISVPVILAGNLAVSLTGGSTLELGDVSQVSTPAALEVSGNGMLILTGSDSYTGGTVVNGGTLVVANNNALESGTSLAVGAGVSGLFAPSIAGAVIPATEGAAAVPEPGTLVLLVVGGLLAAVGALRRRKP